MAEDRQDRPDDLMPAVSRYLRELRRESGELYAHIDALEKALEKEMAKEREREALERAERAAPWTLLSRDSAEERDDEDTLFYRAPVEEAIPPEPKVRERPAAAPSDQRTSQEEAAAEAAGGGGILKVVGNVIFCVAIVALLVGAYLIRSAQEGAPLSIAGYSGMLVLSGSMQDVIPKGSFVLTKSVEPSTLKVGDDITFLTNSTTTVTHRIIDIRPQTDGTLAFKTKGVNNSAPDSSLVSSSNLVGKVIYHNLTIGKVAEGIRGNWPLLLFLMAVFIILSRVLAHIQQEDDEPRESERPRRSGRSRVPAGSRAR